ncbi:hypothetical protein L596_019756 [Steinernema carpocapsae]|uniref:G-protein coupled receptors family 1 profile domain-containing protein n=1 Tax=Steinernema carpocapsae TaxID=34508 RepID=A0A4U5MSB9_STECR|nr:hypothetical protein L596_019756 [Steinernema carpocapsae]
MGDWYETPYNRILDVTAAIHFPIKLFAIYIVAFKTTPQFRHHSYFVLNVLVWNFLGNLLLSFMHLYPVYPSTCIRLDGPLSYLIQSETSGHFVFALMFVCVINVSLALVITFPYRYFVLVRPQATKVCTVRILKICVVLHILATGLFFATYFSWPETQENLDFSKLVCFHSHGWQKMLPVTSFYVYLALLVLITLIFTIVLVVKLYFSRLSNNIKTLKIQRKLLWRLIVQAGIIIGLGGTPLLIAVITVDYPNMPYAKPICLACIVVVANHGTVYSLALISMVKSYRTVLLELFVIFRKSKITFVKSAGAVNKNPI